MIPGLLGIIPGLFGANILGLLLIQPRSLCGIIPGSLGFLDPRWLALARAGSHWLALARAGSRVLRFGCASSRWSLASSRKLPGADPRCQLRSYAGSRWFALTRADSRSAILGKETKETKEPRVSLWSL